MTYSMTAFARAQKQLDTSNLCWEIKSVNHRYLDVSFRLPDAFRFIESILRGHLRNQLSRGKIECHLKFQDTGSASQSVSINQGLVNALMDASDRLSTNNQLSNDLKLSHVLNWPGVVQLNSPDAEAIGQQAECLFKEAIGQLVDARKKEGEALKSHILHRINRLDEEVEQAKKLTLMIADESKSKLLDRVKKIQLEVDEGRLEQEIALIIARLDVSEELDRLQSHLIEVRRILDKETLSGRRLDFLMQELNREANTLSSKSDSVELTRSAVEMKVLIEQMREQIQNIE